MLGRSVTMRNMQWKIDLRNSNVLKVVAFEYFILRPGQT